MLRSFTGTEALSQPFKYALKMYSEKDSVAAKDIVGKSVTFAVDDHDGDPRFFNGVVSRFSYRGRDERLNVYDAEVVPWLWFLTCTTDCRIFQNKSVPEIIEQIFQDSGFSDFTKSDIKGEHGKHDYCVQYNESDLNFVARLMEEEGIFYFFRHEKDKHTLVLADQPGVYADCKDKEVQYITGPTEEAPNNLTAWEHFYQFVPGKLTHTDYNFETPTTDLATNTKSVVSIGENSKFELYEFPGTYGKKSEGDALSKIRMQEQEATFDVVHGASRCRSFNPAGKFKIKKHMAKPEEGKGYVLTSIEHRAESAGFETAGAESDRSYSNTFTCIPDSVVFRAPRSTPKPKVFGVQMAVVTGPPGEEIWPDKYGRVKVQFAWDREGKKDEHSSCWVRVSQIHAGKGWGGIDLPRIGEEVLIAFMEGDPDAPIIVGRVYNAAQTAPFALPASKTISGMKSNTHKGKGYNEMVMDDTAGKENIRVHAQYDMNSTVEHDQSLTVHNNRKTTVEGTYTETITKDTTIKILTGKYNHDVVASTATYHVQGAVSEKFDTTLQTTVNQQAEVVSSTADIHLKAATQILIEVGDSKLLMKADGSIELNGTNITINGTESITNKGKSITSEATADHNVKGNIMVTEGVATNTVKGGMVMLNP